MYVPVASRRGSETGVAAGVGVAVTSEVTVELDVAVIKGVAVTSEVAVELEVTANCGSGVGVVGLLFVLSFGRSEQQEQHPLMDRIVVISNIDIMILWFSDTTNSIVCIRSYL